MLFNKPTALRLMIADAAEGESIYLRFDARRRDVRVPAHLVQEHLVLKLVKGTNAYRIGAGGLDLYVGFQTSWTWCFIPWHALEQIALGESALCAWAPGLEAGPTPDAAGEETPYPHLRLIRGGRTDDLPIEPLPLSTG